MKFNEKLISLRKSMGLSQEELGAELKVSRQTISKWESGCFPQIKILPTHAPASTIIITEP